jgi:hypothetical protein
LAEDQLADEGADDDQADIEMNEVVEFASDDMDDSDFEDLPVPEYELKVDSDSEDPNEESKSEDLRGGTKRKKKAQEKKKAGRRKSSDDKKSEIVGEDKETI